MLPELTVRDPDVGALTLADERPSYTASAFA
jgi:hypothetical protein